MSNTEKITDLYRRLIDGMSRVIVGKEDLKQALIVALLAGGHILIEGPPGTAKTSLAKTFASLVGGEFKRIQFTPDMMPADITGFYFYSPNGTSRYVEGPVFANIVLADELNRTTPRTQSALLQAMQEHQVTIERETRPLPDPFMVIATQVMVGGEGTFPLTDVEVDRFLLRVLSRYVSKEEEKQILLNIDRIDRADVQAVTTLSEIKEIREMATTVYVSPDIIEYTVSIVESLRNNPDIESGPSTRATIALHKGARVLALLDGREFVIPDDVKHLVIPAVEHRLKIKPEAEMDDITPRLVLEKTLEQVPVPKSKL
ncbi:MoxR family ATPase [bacterium]|nr:MAG: MoxR family ATPase [bacterium]